MSGGSACGAVTTSGLVGKVFYGSEIRRVGDISKMDFTAVRQHLSSALGLGAGASDLNSVHLKYRDSDQDWVTVGSQNEWDAALSLGLRSPAKPLALSVSLAPTTGTSSVILPRPAMRAVAADVKQPASKSGDNKAQGTDQPRNELRNERYSNGRDAIMNQFFRLRPKGKWPVQTDVKFPPVITKKSPAAQKQDEWTVVDSDDESKAAERDESKIKSTHDLATVVTGGGAIGKTSQKVIRGRLTNSKASQFVVPKSVATQFSNSLSFALNGVMQTVNNPQPGMKLVEYIRDVAGLTGTKIGCGEGGCGACTVVVQWTDPFSNLITVPVNSCLKPLCAIDGMSVWTTEGIGSVTNGLHPVQRSIADNWGTQCGYCTCGFVMNMYGLLQETPTPTIDQIENNFSGNICRCTGYRPILKAFHTFAQSADSKTHAQTQPPTTTGSGGTASTCSTTQTGTKNVCCATDSKSATTKSTSANGSCKTFSVDAGVRTGAGHKAGCTGSCGTCSHNTSGCASDIEDIGKKIVTPYDAKNPAHNKPFPTELVSYVRKPLYFVDDQGAWFKPSAIEQLYDLLAAYPPQQVRLVVGNTSVAVQKYYRFNPATDAPSIFIDICAIPDFAVIRSDANFLYIGANQSITNVINTLIQAQAQDPAPGVKTRHFSALIRHLLDVANGQVRNVASWAGNLMMAKGHPNFPSDLLTIFTGVGAQVHIESPTTAQWVAVGEPFIAYQFQPSEVIDSIRIPYYPDGTVTFDSFKVASRHQNAHALVNAAFLIQYDQPVPTPTDSKAVATVKPPAKPVAITEGTLHPKSKVWVMPAKPVTTSSSGSGGGVISKRIAVVKADSKSDSKSSALADAKSKGDASVPNIVSITLVYGNIQPSALMLATATAAALVNKPLSSASLGVALPILDGECTPKNDPTDTTWLLVDPNYRRSLGSTLFFKHFITQMKMFQLTIPTDLLSVANRYSRPVSGGSPIFTPAGPSPVGQAIPKLEGYIQASGEAKYSGDNHPGEGYCGSYVTATQATGTITSIDASAALAMPGVRDFLSAVDIKNMGGSNSCGAFPGDEEVFASTEVFWMHQAVGMIVADTQEQADAAALAVTVTYGPPSNPTATPIFNLDEGITANSVMAGNQYMQPPPPISCGDLPTGFSKSNVILQDTIESGIQYHFFMETHTAYATPLENGRMHVYSSSQGTSALRATLATALNCSANKLSVETQHTGGGFGGKLTRNMPIACAVAFAAKKLNKPVRCQNTRRKDIDMWAKRHPFRCDYKVGAMTDGTIEALHMQLYIAGGYTYDTVYGIMGMAINWSDNVYAIPNFKCEGVSIRTNQPANTPMRAPGVLHSVWFIESIVEAVANKLGLDPKAVREKNFYANGNVTPYGQTIQWITLPTVWQNLITQAGYPTKVAACQTFNTNNRWRKQGVRLSPVKYGMTLPGYNAGVLCNICVEDGTIQISQTGCEIGQGINTKVAQAIASCFKDPEAKTPLPMSMIEVLSNRSDVIPNSGETGGSGTSESNVGAALVAGNALYQAILPYWTTGKTYQQAVAAAYAAGANLTSSSTFLMTANNPATDMFTYYVWAAACTMVEIDVLTGEVEILSVDLVYDCGNSLNPAVDIGQIEGAFVQGLGFFFTEEIVTNQDKGYIINNGTWDYKPPSSLDIPQMLNVTLLAAQPNQSPLSVLSSKATGEPPMQLASSAFFAVKDAIRAARAEAGNTADWTLNAPATVEQIQLACGVKYQQLQIS